jgi:hypothetical protein
MSQYSCEPCQYFSDKKHDFIKHELTNKHKKRTSNQPLEIIKMLCVYCDKELSSKSNLTVHENICPKKEILFKEHENKQLMENNEQLINKLHILTEKNKKQKADILSWQSTYAELKEDYEELKDDYNNYLKKFVDSSAGQTNNSHNTTNYNMQYVINNFTNGPTFEDQMKPPISPYEKAEILKHGPVNGCSRLLELRCLKDVSIELRSVHGLDASRNKFIIKVNDCWIVDFKAETILQTTIGKVNNIYIEKMREIKEPAEKAEIVHRLLKLHDKTGDKHILQFLNQNAALQNTNNLIDVI